MLRKVLCRFSLLLFKLVPALVLAIATLVTGQHSFWIGCIIFSAIALFLFLFSDTPLRESSRFLRLFCLALTRQMAALIAIITSILTGEIAFL